MNKPKRDISKYFLPSIKNARKRIEESKIVRDSFNIPENLVNYGVGKKFHIKTFGCQSNVRDSETLMGILEMIGYTHTDSINDADLVLLNTCAVREHAEQKVFADIGVLDKIKRTNPNFIFGMCGCMAQEESIVNKILKSNSNIDFIFGTHNIHRVLNILEQVIFEKNLIIEVWSKEGDIIENLPSFRNSNIKAFVNVMYGCDKFCTYCIVPFTRGKIRSRSKEDIIAEVKSLIKDGYKEVTLIGQNVNSYGIDFKGEQKYLFHDLLKDVAETGIKRLRFTTSNPWNFTKEIVDTMRSHPNIMPHIHLPIQSGDELILKRMNRPMKIGDYISLVNYIKKNIPNCSITTDIIVGFPNESREQFEKTLELYNTVQFDNAFTCQPVCGPARASLQTGLYSSKTDVFVNAIPLNKNIKTIASYFSDNGYQTAYVGKWHLASTGVGNDGSSEDYIYNPIYQYYQLSYKIPTLYWKKRNLNPPLLAS